MSTSAAERAISNAQVTLLMTQEGHFSAARSLLSRHEGGGVELAAAMNLFNDGVEQLKKVNAHLTTARRAVVAQQATINTLRTSPAKRPRVDVGLQADIDDEVDAFIKSVEMKVNIYSLNKITVYKWK